MARWQKRQDFLPTQTGTSAAAGAAGTLFGQTFRWEITREFPIEAIFIKAEITAFNSGLTPGAPAASTSQAYIGDGPWNLLKRIQVTIADGARTRNCVDITGIGLAEYYRQIAGALPGIMATPPIDHPTGGTYAGNTSHYMWPIPFVLPNLSDPIASCLLLPAPRYNSNIILNVQMAAALTDVFNYATNKPNLEVKLTPVIIRRDVRDPNWTYLDSELTEMSISPTIGGSNQMYELQIPGSYTGMLLRGYRGTTARGDISMVTGYGTAASATFGEYSLRLLGNVIRRNKWVQQAYENDLSIFDVARPSNLYGGTIDQAHASMFWDFLNDHPGQEADHFGSVLDTNPLMATGARLQLFLDCAAGLTAPSVQLVSHRIFGDLSSFKPSKAAAA